MSGLDVDGLELPDALQSLAPDDYQPVVGSAITGVVVGGALLILCGVAMLAPLRRHRPIGVVAAIFAVVVVVAVVVVWSRLGNLLEGGLGSWLFVLAAPVSVAGAILGLVRR